MGRKTRKVNQGQSVEATVAKLRSTIDGLKSNLAIYDHNIAQSLEKLKADYNIDTIEAGIDMVERIDVELRAREVELEKTTQEIAVALEAYS